MAGDPETYFITDHYRNYAWVLVRFSKVHPDALHKLLHIGYSNASPAKPHRKLTSPFFLYHGLTCEEHRAGHSKHTSASTPDVTSTR